MKQRIVVGLTLLFFVGLSAFVSTTVIQNQQKNAFEDLQLTSDSSPNPDASATTTPDPCASPTATATAGIGTSPSPAGSSESNINRGGQTPTADPSASATASVTPCPSPSPGDGTATATTTVTATTTANTSPTAGVSVTATSTMIATVTIAPTVTRTPAKTVTPTPCPTDDGGSTDPECDTISVLLRYKVHDKDPNPRIPKDKPRMRLNPTEYPIDGRIDGIQVRFYCDGFTQVVKDVNERGVASIKQREIGCALKNVKAKVLKYLTNDDDGAVEPIPRKETTRMYYLYFPDFDNSNLKDTVGNYIDSSGKIVIKTDIGLVMKGSNTERKVIGIQPAVGGIAKVEGNNASERTVCFSYLYLENLGPNFSCSNSQTMIRTKTDKNGWYMFGTNKRPWNPETPLINNFDDRLSFGKFIALVKQNNAKNVFVTTQNTDTNRWIEFDAVKNNPKPLIGGHGEGVAGKEKTKWNRKDCGCLDRSEDVVNEALQYVHPSGTRNVTCRWCAGWVSQVIAERYNGVAGVGLIATADGTDAVSTLRANLKRYAEGDSWQQVWPPLPGSWSTGYNVNDANTPGTSTNTVYSKLVPGDVVTASRSVRERGYEQGGRSHAWIFAGSGKSLLENRWVTPTMKQRIRLNDRTLTHFYVIGTSGTTAGPRVIASKNGIVLADATLVGWGVEKVWAAFSARCWQDWR